MSRSYAIFEPSGDQMGRFAATPASPWVSCLAFEPSAPITNTCSFPFPSRPMYVTIDPSSVKSKPDAPAGAVNAVAVPEPTSTIDSVCSASAGGDGGLDPEAAGWTSSLPSVLIPIATPATTSTATRT